MSWCWCIRQSGEDWYCAPIIDHTLDVPVEEYIRTQEKLEEWKERRQWHRERTEVDLKDFGKCSDGVLGTNRVKTEPEENEIWWDGPTVDTEAVR